MNLTYAEAARHHRLAHAVFGFRDELIVSESIIARKRAKAFRRFTGAGLAFQAKPPAIGTVLFLRLAIPACQCRLSMSQFKLGGRTISLHPRIEISTMTTKIYRRRGRRNNRRPTYITKFAVFCQGCGAGYVQVCDGSYPTTTAKNVN